MGQFRVVVTMYIGPDQCGHSRPVGHHFFFFPFFLET